MSVHDLYAFPERHTAPYLFRRIFGFGGLKHNFFNLGDRDVTCDTVAAEQITVPGEHGVFRTMGLDRRWLADATG